ncbi:putative membrane protein (plasmid) [Sinorhizobium sp. RAC02]|nr:putative membrane protein [Sinorhizobium sp. RAC02]
MVYEWDAKRARRAYSIKWLSVGAATLATVGLPLWLVLHAMGFLAL